MNDSLLLSNIKEGDELFVVTLPVDANHQAFNELTAVRTSQKTVVTQ